MIFSSDLFPLPFFIHFASLLLRKRGSPPIHIIRGREIKNNKSNITSIHFKIMQGELSRTITKSCGRIFKSFFLQRDILYIAAQRKTPSTGGGVY